MYFLLRSIYETIIHGQLLRMTCLLGTFEDFFCKQERLDVANLAEMIKDNNTNKKSESKTAGQDFSQNAKILELSFIENNWGTLIGRVKMNKKAGCLALVKIIHHSLSKNFHIREARDCPMD